MTENRPYDDQDARDRAKNSNATGIPGAQVAFRVTLTETSNPYLQHRLPCPGLVSILERDVVGGCQSVIFMPDPKPGMSTSFVQVPDAKFEFHTNH